MKAIGCVVGLLAGLAVSATAGDGVVTLAVAPDQQFGAWTLDEATGAVFATEPDAGRVVEFDPVTGAQRRSFTAPSQEYMTSLVVKGRRLLLSDPRREGLTAFELDSGQQAFSLPIPALRGAILVAADRPEPWVWGVAGRDRELALVQVDVAQGTVLRRTPLAGWGADGPTACVSRDGRLLLVRDRWSTHVFALDGRDGRLWLVAATRDEEQGIAVAGGPCARTWVINNRIAPNDLSVPMLGTRFENPPVLHPRRDLAFAVSTAGGWRLDAFRASTGDELARVPLGPAHQGRGPWVHVDGARDRVLCAWTERAFVVDVTKLGAGRGLLLRADPPAVAVVVGATVGCEVVAADGATPAPTLALIDPPAGASVDAGAITWRPTNAQVGRHRLRVQGRRGEEQDEVTVVVDVRREAIALDFVVGSLCVDGEGRRVLASSSGGERSYAERASETKAALIDVSTSSVVGQRSLGREPRSLALTSDGAYVLHQSPNTLLRLRLPDLADEKRGSHEGLSDMTVVGQRVVGCFGQPHDGGVLALDAGSFDEVWRASLRAFSAPSGSSRTPDGGAIVGGLVLVRPDGGVRALVAAPPGLPLVTPARSATAQASPQRAAARHPSLPVSLTATREHRADGTFVQLEVRDLVEDKVVATLPVAVVSRNTPFPAGHMDWTPPIVGAAGRAVVAVGATVYVVPLDAEVLAKLAARLQVTPTPERPPVVRSDAAALTIPFAAHGGTGGYRFELEGPLAGVRIDAATGAVTVDPGVAWKAFVEGVKGPLHWDRDRARALLELLGSPDLAGCPLSLSIGVRARDGEQQARTSVVVTVVGPADEVEKAVTAAAAARTPAAVPADVGAAAAAQLARETAAELRALRGAVEASRAEATGSGAAAAQATEAARATAQALETLRQDLEAARRELAVVQAAAHDGAVREAAAQRAAERASGTAIAGVVLAVAALALALRRGTTASPAPAAPGPGAT